MFEGIANIIGNTISFGEFELSSGKKSDHYFDLRKLISDPQILKRIVCQIKTEENSEEIICGVPYGAIPLATAYSLEHNVGLLILRKEPKNHGCKKLIEGGDNLSDRSVTLIDDVWTTGKSMKQAQQQLENEGFVVKRKVVILYRGEGEPPEDLEYLFVEKELLELPIIRFKKHLYNKGTLCFAADLPLMSEIVDKIHLVNLHSELSVVKLHPELIEDWSEESIASLCALSDEMGFLLWADIKICEVPHIALKQLEKYAWADLVSVMSIVGAETLSKLQDKAEELGSKCKYPQSPLMLILVSTLHTEGNKIWSDEQDFEEIEWTNFVGSVGRRVPGLTYIRAGIPHTEIDSHCDLQVRGRSLIDK